MENINFKAIIENIILYVLKVFAHFGIGEADPDGFKAWMDEEAAKAEETK